VTDWHETIMRVTEAKDGVSFTTIGKISLRFCKSCQCMNSNVCVWVLWPTDTEYLTFPQEPPSTHHTKTKKTESWKVMEKKPIHIKPSRLWEIRKTHTAIIGPPSYRNKWSHSFGKYRVTCRYCCKWRACPIYDILYIGIFLLDHNYIYFYFRVFSSQLRFYQYHIKSNIQHIVLYYKHDVLSFNGSILIYPSALTLTFATFKLHLSNETTFVFS